MGGEHCMKKHTEAHMGVYAHTLTARAVLSWARSRIKKLLNFNAKGQILAKISAKFHPLVSSYSALNTKKLLISNLGMISSISVKKFFNLVKSFDFYGRLKLVKWHFSMDHFRGQERSGTSKFCDIIQGTRQNALSAHMQIFCVIYIHSLCLLM